MKKYDYEKIDKLLQPVMNMMREEFPNDCKLIVQGDSSQIVFEHNYLTFLSNEMKKPICETDSGKAFFESVKNFAGEATKIVKQAAEESGEESGVAKLKSEVRTDGE